jgi:hypothetical protein
LPSRSALAAVALGVVGLACAAGSAAFTARRSTIPLALDARVASVVLLPEKHAGVDDVRLLRMEDGTEHQVDEAVFLEAAPGRVLSKAAWDRTLRVDGREVALSWSEEARGMAVAMPLAFLLLAVALAYGARVPMRRP